VHLEAKLIVGISRIYDLSDSGFIMKLTTGFMLTLSLTAVGPFDHTVKEKEIAQKVCCKRYCQKLGIPEAVS